MKKRIFALLLSIALLSSVVITPVRAESTGDCTVRVCDTAAIAGDDRVAVDILLEGNPGIAGFSFCVNYDTEKLVLVETKINIESGYQVVSQPTGYGVNLAWTSSSGYSEDGKIATLYFNVPKDITPGQTNIDIVYRGGYDGFYDSNERDIEVNTYNGQMSIAALQEADGPSVNIGGVSANMGATDIVVPITVQNNPGFSGFSLCINYDTSRLVLENAKVLIEDGYKVISYPEGYGVNIAWTDLEAYTNDGTIAELHFSLKDGLDSGKAYIETAFRDGYDSFYSFVNGTEQDIAFDSFSGYVDVKSHHYGEGVITRPATCITVGVKTFTCSICGDSYTEEVAATGHSFVNGSCTSCGTTDPDHMDIVVPTLALKAPALEFKDMIKVIAFFTVDNTQDVVEMGMITYTEKVDVIDINTAAHVIPGAEYEESSKRYFASSQGIHAKYLGDTVYLACYARLSDGTYVYTKLAPYSPITYATNQLKNSADMKLKQLVAAMLNYGAAAQNYFVHNTDVLANSTLTDEQKALPEAYRADMVATVPAADAAKQGIFANNQGFSSRRPAVSFEGAFSINYFFTPKYAPVDGITLHYWTEADFNAADILTAQNASGSIVMDGEGVGQYRGDIEGIAAKDLSKAVYVAAVYSDVTTTWTSGVLGYSIGAYCASMAKGTDAMADLAMATAVYGYHAKAYFG